MNRKRASLTLEKHTVKEVFVSSEYLEMLGIMDRVIEAAETDNFTRVYEILIADAKEHNDISLLQIVAGEHEVSTNSAGIRFVAVSAKKNPSSAGELS